MNIVLRALAYVCLIGCETASVVPDAVRNGDAAAAEDDAAMEMPNDAGVNAGVDAGETPDSSEAPDAGTAFTGLGEIAGVQALAMCPRGTPSGASCQHIMVQGCPGFESEALGTTIAVLPPNGTLRGTITRFIGGGGDGFLTLGATEFQAAGFRQVFVSWDSDWEQTAALGIKAAACRPATVLAWVFANDSLHAMSRSLAFCADGKSGGSGQVSYALATYGLGDRLDYVGLLAGPPFARIDLGCDGDAPATTTVCGESVTMRLPDKVGTWENMPPPLMCGSTGVPPQELERWREDSIAYGGTYLYPNTRVELFDCTNNTSAVTGMSQLLYDQILSAEGDTTNVEYHCYGAADGCRGEGLGPTGEQDMIDAMLASCIPRH